MKSFFFSSVLSCLRTSVFALSAGLLASCATPVPGDTGSQQGIQAARNYQEAVNIAGRLSIRYQEDGSEQSLHGSFNWSQQPGRILVSLLSPLGNTLATIESTPSQTILRQPGKAPQVASDVDTLTAQTLGWPLPVAGLRHWLQGFASDGDGLVNSDGRHAIAAPSTLPQTSEQNGWRLHYASWNHDAAPPHPRRLDLQRYTPQAGNVEIRLIVDSFQPL